MGHQQAAVRLAEHLAHEEVDDEVSAANEEEDGDEEKRGVEAFLAGSGRSDAEVEGEEVIDGGLEEGSLGLGRRHGLAHCVVVPS